MSDGAWVVTVPDHAVHKSVAIVGFASRSCRSFVPEGWREVWGLNNGTNWPSPDKRWDRWFDMHYPEYIRTLPRYEWLRSQNPTSVLVDGTTRPIYCLDAMEDIPGSVRFPYEQVDAFLRSMGCDTEYYTSSFSYMFGLALMEGFTRIGLYGIDLAEEYEMYFERAGLEYLIGLARGMGVEVVIPPESPLLRIAYRYSYDEPMMSLKVVQPFMDMLAAEIEATERQQASALDRWRDMNTRDLPESESGEAHAYNARAQHIASMQAIRVWYRLYGHRGTLLAPGYQLQGVPRQEKDIL